MLANLARAYIGCDVLINDETPASSQNESLGSLDVLVTHIVVEGG